MLPLEFPSLMFGLVEILEQLETSAHSTGQNELDRIVMRPLAEGQHVHIKLHNWWHFVLFDLVLDVLSERLTEINRQLHVLEHALQLVREAGATFCKENRFEKLQMAMMSWANCREPIALTVL